MVMTSGHVHVIQKSEVRPPSLQCEPKTNQITSKQGYKDMNLGSRLSGVKTSLCPHRKSSRPGGLSEPRAKRFHISRCVISCNASICLKSKTGRVHKTHAIKPFSYSSNFHWRSVSILSESYQWLITVWCVSCLHSGLKHQWFNV